MLASHVNIIFDFWFPYTSSVNGFVATWQDWRKHGRYSGKCGRGTRTTYEVPQQYIVQSVANDQDILRIDCIPHDFSLFCRVMLLLSCMCFFFFWGKECVKKRTSLFFKMFCCFHGVNTDPIFKEKLSKRTLPFGKSAKKVAEAFYW